MNSWAKIEQLRRLFSRSTRVPQENSKSFLISIKFYRCFLFWNCDNSWKVMATPIMETFDQIWGFLWKSRKNKKNTGGLRNNFAALNSYQNLSLKFMEKEFLKSLSYLTEMKFLYIVVKVHHFWSSDLRKMLEPKVLGEIQGCKTVNNVFFLTSIAVWNFEVLMHG